jgi:hypothetical protein
MGISPGAAKPVMAEMYPIVRVFSGAAQSPIEGKTISSINRTMNTLPVVAKHLLLFIDTLLFWFTRDQSLILTADPLHSLVVAANFLAPARFIRPDKPS